MRNTLVCMVLAAATASAGWSDAAEKADRTAWAATIARFIDEQTFLIVRVDVSRLPAAPILGLAAQWLPEADGALRELKAFAADVDAFLRSGGREVYLVSSMADFSLRDPQAPLFAVVPLPPGADARGLVELLRKVGRNASEQRDGVLVAGSSATLQRLKALKPDRRAELVPAMEAAGDRAVQVLFLPPRFWTRVIEEMLPTLPDVVGGGPSNVLTRGVRWAALGIDPPPALGLQLTIQSADGEAAVAFQRKWADLWKLLKAEKDVVQMFPQFDELVRLLTPEVRGDRLVLELDPQRGFSILLSALKPSLERARASARTAQSMNNLRQLATAMHQYHDKHKRFPAAANHDAQGRPLLSWRVHLLPYLGQESLYRQFKLDEPWDSPHNQKLVEAMPAVYRSPLSKRAEKGRTNYLVPVGQQTLFPPGPQGVALAEIKDGTSMTILVVEADDDRAVIWTRPEDLPVEPEQPVQGLKTFDAEDFLAAFADGSVRAVSAKDAKSLRAMLTREGRDGAAPR